MRDLCQSVATALLVANVTMGEEEKSRMNGVKWLTNQTEWFVTMAHIVLTSLD